ncbi:MAG TPA: SMP-30/gluconolactonase/LRE family protein [Methylophilus sp.]|nr:SMP-30/gluconolactonase/LRE family protein [Methylophilus sp.]
MLSNRHHRRTLFSSILASFLMITGSTGYSHGLEPVSGLLTPESAVQAADGKIYVSEINGFGQDGDGQIRVIDHGKSSVLVQGLDDPKGLVIIGNDLYIADKSRVLRIALNQETASAEVFLAATDFPKVPQFLNDLSADANGNLYISDSGDILGTGKGGAIYKVTPQRKLSLLLDGNIDARILAPNGLLADAKGEHLLLVDFTSGVLYNYNQVTKKLEELANGFGGGDGIVKQANGNIYVSDWKNGKVFRVDPQHKVSLIKEGYQSAADIALTQDDHHLLVPDMKAGKLEIIDLR